MGRLAGSLSSRHRRLVTGERTLRRDDRDDLDPAGEDPTTTAEPLPVELGRRLRRARIERGLSRVLVAARLRRSVKHIAEHEGGIRRIEAGELSAYLRLFDISISTLFEDPPGRGFRGSARLRRVVPMP